MKTLKPWIMHAAAAVCLSLPAAALAQASAARDAYPLKPVRMVLTYSGGIDAITRLICQRLGESMGQPFLVLRTQEVRAKLEQGGLLLVASNPDELAQAVKRDLQTVAGIVKRAGIAPE